MPQRRALQQGLMPGLPMTGSGTSGEMFDPSEIEQPDLAMESPETRRRRLTPAIGYPQPQPTTIQQLMATMKGGR